MRKIVQTMFWGLAILLFTACHKDNTSNREDNTVLGLSESELLFSNTASQQHITVKETAWTFGTELHINGELCKIGREGYDNMATVEYTRLKNGLEVISKIDGEWFTITRRDTVITLALDEAISHDKAQALRTLTLKLEGIHQMEEINLTQLMKPAAEIEKESFRLSDDLLLFDAQAGTQTVSIQQKEWQLHTLYINGKKTELQDLETEYHTIGQREIPVQASGDWFTVCCDPQRMAVTLKANDTEQERELVVLLTGDERAGYVIIRQSK